MGGKNSILRVSSRRQPSMPPGSHVAANVDPDTALPPSDHHQGNGVRDGSNVSSSTIAASNSVVALYEEACREIPEFQSFEERLKLRTRETVVAIATDADKRTISLATLRKAADCVFDTEEDAVRRILQNDEDIGKRPELKALVEEYLDSSSRTLQFCLDLKKCVMNARNMQMMNIKLALKRFEEEEEEAMDEGRESSVGIRPEKFQKTLEALKCFTELREPFTEEFLRVFRNILEQQKLMLDKLNSRSKTLKNKLKRIKSWRKVSGIVFASVFAVALVCTVVAAALSAPAVVTALATAATTAFGPIGKWFQSLWNNYESPFRRELNMINKMESATTDAIGELNTLKFLVDRLTIDAQSLRVTAEFALRYDDAVVLAIKDIQKKLNEFEEWLDMLEDRAEACGKAVRQARVQVCDMVKKYSK